MIMLGRGSGRQLHALAHNRDPRPVLPRRRRPRSDPSALSAAGRARSRTSTPSLVGLVDRVTRRMRDARRIGRTVVLRLRFGDYSRATRSHTLPRGTAETYAILATARGLLAAARPMIERQGLTLVGVAVANLENDRPVQLLLPFERDRRGPLDAALDEVRERFGPAAVTRGVLLGRGQGLTVPLLPD